MRSDAAKQYLKDLNLTIERGEKSVFGGFRWILKSRLCSGLYFWSKDRAQSHLQGIKWNVEDAFDSGRKSATEEINELADWLISLVGGDDIYVNDIDNWLTENGHYQRHGIL